MQYTGLWRAELGHNARRFGRDRRGLQILGARILFWYELIVLLAMSFAVTDDVFGQLVEGWRIMLSTAALLVQK
jgi:hypothetical protein